MGKLIKFLVGLILLLVLLVVAAAVIVPMVVDPNDFKPEIVNQVKKATGRDMQIDGDIKLSVFPWLGVELGAISLNQPEGFGDSPFAAIKQAQLKAKMMPLLKKQLEVDTVELHGLELNLIRSKEGVGNWEDLAAGAGAAPETAADETHDSEDRGLESLAIGGVSIADAVIVWDDRQAGQKVAVRNFSLETGALAPGEAADLKLGFKLDNEAPKLSATLGLSGNVDASEDFRKIQVRGFEFRADDVKMDDGLAANVLLKAEILFDAAANKLQVSGLNVQKQVSGGPLQNRTLESGLVAALDADLANQIFLVSGVGLDALLKGEDIPGGEVQTKLKADVNADLGKDTLKISGLDLQAAGLHLSGQLNGTGVTKAPAFSGKLNLAEVNLRELMQRFGVAPPMTSDPQVLQRFSLSTDIKSDAKQAGLTNLKINLDDSKLSGDATVLLGKAMGYRFNLDLDSINADRYLPPAAEKPAADANPGAAQQPAGDPNAPLFTQEQLQQLRGLDVDGRFSVGHLTISNIKLDKAVIKLQAKNGDIKLDQKVGAFYQGKLGGNIGLNVSGDTPRVKVTQNIDKVQAENLVKDLTGKDQLSGTGNFNLDVNGKGKSVPAIKRALNGKLDFAFADGAVKGINIGRMLREAAAKLKGQSLPPEKGVQKTDFSELSGSGVITNGVLDNQDLQAKSPLFRVTGKGKINIGEDTLDYKVKPVLVASLQGQGGEDINKLKGVPIPVHLTGPLAEPKWRIDVAEALAESQKAKLKEKAGEELKKVIPADVQKKLPGGLNKQLDGALKGLFN